MTPLTSVHYDNNANLVREVAAFYIKDEDLVADVTYGKGAFWKTTDTSRFALLPSDIATYPDAPYDFRKLPYADGCLDHVVLDPPYMHSPGKTSAYQGQYQTTQSHGLNGGHDLGRTMYHNEIMEDYASGMSEAARVLKVGGMLWVKTKDEIESGTQRWSHIEVFNVARHLKLIGKDLFILITKGNIPSRNARQLHARKGHSYLWLFLKPTASQARAVTRGEGRWA